MRDKAFLIGISGGSGSGKTTIAQKLFETLSPDCAFISEDDYYKDTSSMAGFDAKYFDFDNPIIRDHELLINDLAIFLENKAINHPIYDFENHCRKQETKTIVPSKFLIIEGTHTLFNPQLREKFDLKIFVHADEEIRFSRRLARDISERGRSVESVYEQFARCVKPGHDKWTEPSRQFADVILDCNDPPNFDIGERLSQNLGLILQKIKRKA